MASGSGAVKSLNSTRARERVEVDEQVKKGAKGCQMCSLMLMVLCAFFIHRSLHLSAKNANALDLQFVATVEVWMVVASDVKKIYNVFVLIGQNILYSVCYFKPIWFLVQL